MSLRRDGPEWFTRKIPYVDPKKMAETLEIWRSYLSCQLFNTFPQKTFVIVMPYQRNLVARQFGQTQVINNPNFTFAKKPVSFSVLPLKDLRVAEDRHRAISLNLDFFEYEISHLTTLRVETWWSDYFHKVQKSSATRFIDPTDRDQSKKNPGSIFFEPHSHFLKFLMIILI